MTTRAPLPQSGAFMTTISKCNVDGDGGMLAQPPLKSDAHSAISELKYFIESVN
ncbi:MAG: hypothetical protein H8E25_13630 [Planctomycetes bacterium]|nr:hypothetical protein [Planctomycetota bacterium]